MDATSEHPAGRPTALAVDDDRAVLHAVERDLRRHLGERYRVLAAASGADGLDLLGRLKLRDEDVALLLVDQRMPVMSGVEFLSRAREVYPSAKRVLLTAYADTDAAIKAINEVDLDHYLLKPWDPPEERLFPVLDDVLADWEASAKPRSEVRVVGHRWSSDSHGVKDFLTRNGVPYEWLDIDRDLEAKQILAVAAVGRRLPVVLFRDGTLLEAPTNLEIAKKIGLTTRAELPFYDLVIVGGGPAGLAAAVYGASEGLRTVMVEREAPGGQAGQSSRIENYLGFPSGLSGYDLARRGIAQARRFGAEMISVQEAAAIETRGPSRVVRLTGGAELACHTVLLATGVAYRRLDAPGVDELTGSGVYYGAALTEAVECANQEVLLVGGANSAGQAAMHFARFAARVTLLVRGDSLERTMSRYLIDQLAGSENIEVRLGTEVRGVHGNGKLESVTVTRGDGAEETMEANALFVFIGAQPRTDWLGDLVARDSRGFVLSGPDLGRDGSSGWPLERDPYLLETSVPGIFVAGDVRARSMKRVASAVGEGAMAVQFVHEYLADV